MNEPVIQPAIVSYDRARVIALIREQSVDALYARLRAGEFDATLDNDGRVWLVELLTAWRQRALGQLTLRDAMLVDPHRGRHVFGLLCAIVARARVDLPPHLAVHLPAAPTDLAELPPALAAIPELAALAQQAAQEGLTLAWQAQRYDFPLPGNLIELTPPFPPRPPNEVTFEQPTGLRRQIAIALAALGVGLLIGPLLLGQIPDHPAGWPLALLTLALMVGIAAGLSGYLGALCIWLVANLPAFRHGTALIDLWPAIPLMAIGLFLLWRDRRVRAMWRFIRRQFRRQRDATG